MASTWVKTSHPGVRYREHPTRKHGVRKDRYYTIRFRVEGVLKEEALGWASEGWDAERAAVEVGKLKANKRLGTGPRRLEEAREAGKAQERARKASEAKESREAITFAAFFRDHYEPLARANKKAESFRREDSLYRHWLEPILGPLPLALVGAAHLERIKQNMQQAGKAPRSVHYALAVVRQVFNVARRLDYFHSESPTSKVKKPTNDNRRLRFLSHEEANTLLAALADKSTQLHDMALVALHTGARAGEIFSLQWGDIDLEHGIISLRDTKGGRNRQAIMTEAVKTLFTDLPTGARNEHVFPSRTGERIKAVSRTFDKVADEIGFNHGVDDPRLKVVFHTLRHTFASWLVMAGVDLYTVKTLMGHQTISQTERYSHLAPNAMRQAVQAFESGMAQNRH
jgi:integrase